MISGPCPRLITNPRWPITRIDPMTNGVGPPIVIHIRPPGAAERGNGNPRPVIAHHFVKADTGNASVIPTVGKIIVVANIYIKITFANGDREVGASAPYEHQQQGT